MKKQIGKIVVGLTVAVAAVLLPASIASAITLNPGQTLVLNNGPNCVVTVTYGQAYGIVPIASMESGNPAKCIGSTITVVYGLNGQTRSWTCQIGNTGAGCSLSGTGLNKVTALGDNYWTAYGLHAHICKDLPGSVCLDYSASAFG